MLFISRFVYVDRYLCTSYGVMIMTFASMPFFVDLEKLGSASRSTTFCKVKFTFPTLQKDRASQLSNDFV